MTRSKPPCIRDGIFVTSLDLSHSFNLGVAQEVMSGVALQDQKKEGVYYFQIDADKIVVRIIGLCPNWTEGGCRKGESCLSVIRERG